MLFSRYKLAVDLLLFEVDLFLFKVYLLSQKKRFLGGCREKERFICIIQKKVVPLQSQRFSNGVLVHLARAQHWQC